MWRHFASQERKTVREIFLVKREFYWSPGIISLERPIALCIAEPASAVPRCALRHFLSLLVGLSVVWSATAVLQEHLWIAYQLVASKPDASFRICTSQFLLFRQLAVIAHSSPQVSRLAKSGAWGSVWGASPHTLHLLTVRLELSRQMKTFTFSIEQAVPTRPHHADSQPHRSFSRRTRAYRRGLLLSPSCTASL